MDMKRIFTKKGKINYAINLLPRRFWFELWKPTWHEGRGYYISIGLWIVAFYRGY
jgi:hypothetical protein